MDVIIEDKYLRQTHVAVGHARTRFRAGIGLNAK
jgi:hypothetical protein